MKTEKAFSSLFVIIMIFTGGFLFAQTEGGGIPAAENIVQLDAVIRSLAAQAGTRLDALDAGSRIGAGDFLFEGSPVSMGTYWRNQLVSGLVERPGRKFILDNNAGTGEAAYALSGEILLLGSTVRVYTRLSNVRESSLLAVWITDLRYNSYLDELISRSSSPSSSSSSGRVIRDSFEEDSMDNPVEIPEGTWISRTLHSDDEDWFLFGPAAAGRYTAETSGGIDTYMELYGAENSSKMAEDDDEGDDYNARITFSAANGTSYLIKIRGYDGDTGQYRLRVRAGE